MKTIRNILSAVIASGIAGVALLSINNLIQADIAVAILTTGGLFAFAIFDYTRDTAPLRVAGEVVRPTLPKTTAPSRRDARRAA